MSLSLEKIANLEIIKTLLTIVKWIIIPLSYFIGFLSSYWTYHSPTTEDIQNIQEKSDQRIISELRGRDGIIKTELEKRTQIVSRDSKNAFIEQFTKNKGNKDVLRVLAKENASYLNEMTIGALDFSGLDMFRARLDGSRFEATNFSETNLEEMFCSKTKFLDVNMSQVNMQYAYCDGPLFIHTNLSGAKASQVTMNHAGFQESDLTEADFAHAQLPFIRVSGGDLSNADFTSTNLSNAVIEGVHLEKVNFTFSELANSRFTGNKIVDAIFSGTNLEQSDFGPYVIQVPNHPEALLPASTIWDTEFQDVRAKQSKFDLATLTRVKFNDRSTLDQSSFARTKLKEVTFDNSSLKKASFIRATVKDTFFDSTSLEGSIFEGATLTDVVFSSANLKDATFKAATFKNVSFEDTVLDGATWVNGERCRANSKGRCCKQPEWKTLFLGVVMCLEAQ